MEKEDLVFGKVIAGGGPQLSEVEVERVYL